MPNVQEHVEGAIWGMLVADALAMPVHWYYTPGTIERDFGPNGIQTYQAPKHPHPDAFAWSMTYSGTIDIYHGVQKYVRDSKPPPEENFHYHYGLHAGDVTLQMQWARVLLQCLGKDGVENQEWAQAFVAFIQTPSPALNNDIYRDVFIRRFFERLSEGLPLAECPIPQKDCWSVGSMGGVIPGILTALSFANSPDTTMEDVVARCIEIHMKTHHSENVTEAVTILAPLIVQLCRARQEPASEYLGDPSEASFQPETIDPRRMLILNSAKSCSLPAITGASLLRRYNKARGPGNIPKDEMYNLHTKKREGFTFDPSLYMDVPDENVIGRKGFLGTVCYTEHGVPAILYLAYKYFEEPALALKVNANLLGDSTSRGSLLGCVLGAAHGKEWCQDLISGLRQKKEFQQEIERFSKAVVS